MRRVFLLCSAVLSFLISTPGVEALPQPRYPALAIVNDASMVSVALSGSGFGNPVAGSSLAVEGLATPIPSTQSCATSAPPCILHWDDGDIAAKLPTTFAAPVLSVIVGADQSDPFRAQTYNYDFFNINAGGAATSGTNPSPLALDIRPSDHSVWIDEEFHKKFKYIVPGSSPAQTTVSIPSNTWSGNLSVLGEDVLVDPLGRVWMSEGGNYLYGIDSPTTPRVPNRSRIVVYAGGPTLPIAYNLPGDNIQTFGLWYEKDYVPGHDRMWYTAIRQYYGGNYFPFNFLPARVGWFEVATSGTPAGFPTGNNSSTPFTDTGTCGTLATKLCHAFDPYGVVCTTDAQCAPHCVSGVCQFGKLHATCTVDADCTPACVANRCDGGNLGNCLADSNCMPRCEVKSCSDNALRACEVNDDCAYTNVVCAGNDLSAGCFFHEFILPPKTFVPANIARGLDGAIWVVDSWGTDGLLRVDPATGEVRSFPVGDDPTRGQNWGPGSSPFEVHIAANGDVITNEYTDFCVSRLDIGLVDSGEESCEVLTGTQNPCMTVVPVPGPSLAVPGPSCPAVGPCGGSGQPACPAPTYYSLHTIAPDPRGNVWFTTAGSVSDPSSRASVGFVKADWTGAVLFPPLSIYPFNDDGANSYCHPDPNCNTLFRAFHGAGIRVDQSNEDVWFSDYCRKRVGRMRPKSTNLALNRPATQAGTLVFGGITASAGLAVDGNIDGAFPHGSVSHTFDFGGNVQPWWQVDLGGSLPIDALEVWNRTDECCTTSLHDFDVFVTDDPAGFPSNDPTVIATSPGVFSIHQSGVAGRRYATAIGRTGRWLRIQLRGTGDGLALAEVVVLGGRCTDAASCTDGDTCTPDSCDTGSGQCSHGCNIGTACATCGNTCKLSGSICSCAP